MRPLPDHSEIREFRAFLDDQRYDSKTLTRLLGRAQPPAPGEERLMLDASRQVTTGNVLARLFLLGASVDADIVHEFVPEPVLGFCINAGLLANVDASMRGSIVIIPVEDLLFASDAYHMLGTREASQFVLPASTHSANFLRLLTLRAPVDSTLDLGCGCGIQALFAARHSKHVVATDVSERALRYTRFNAMLNDLDNVECIEGSLFEPVADRRFDLIVSNPPFVIGPSESYVYRDNPMQLDELCRALVSEAPAYLEGDGHLQMLCESVEIDGESWDERIRNWVRGCDAWILHATPVSPDDYVARRTADISGDAVNVGSSDDWKNYFAAHRVRAVHPVVLTLRRREGANWLHLQNLPGDVTTEAGDAVAAGIESVDFLEACDDDALLEAVIGIADELGAEQLKSGDEISGVYLRLENGLGTDAEIDGPVAAFLNLFNGKRTVRECVREFGAATEANMDKLTADLLSIVRVFVSRGFLVPRDVD